MAKPICVIYFPDHFVDGIAERNWIYEYMRFLNGDRDQEDKYKYRGFENFNDYHWFCFYKQGINEPELKVFYEKDFTEIQFEELKKLITDSIETSLPNKN